MNSNLKALIWIFLVFCLTATIIVANHTNGLNKRKCLELTNTCLKRNRADKCKSICFYGE